jgi:hypothetical protein
MVYIELSFIIYNDLTIIVSSFMNKLLDIHPAYAFAAAPAPPRPSLAFAQVLICCLKLNHQLILR